MRVALIHGKYFNSWEALGLAYIASYVRKNEPDVELIFFQGCFDDEETIVTKTAECDIVAFSCTTPTFPYVANISRMIKSLNPKTRIVVGGYHPSAASLECLTFKEIDQVVIGEGESAILEIIRGNKEKVLYGRMLNFDELPWPDRKLIKNERNIEIAYKDNKKRITSFQSHRGCAFRCAYCADGNRVMCGKSQPKIRHRNVNDLLNEMQRVTEEFGLDLLKFCDATWNLGTNWVIDFCEEKIRRGFTIPFYPNIHPGLATCSEEMFARMAEAKCFEIAIGVESGSEKILKQIGKGTNKYSITRCVNLAKKAGLKIRGYFILGMPEESENDINETEKFAEELQLDEYGFTILCPWPGTQMYDPKIHTNIDWGKTDEYTNDFWKTSYLTNAQLKESQKQLLEKFSSHLTWHHKEMLKAENANKEALS